MTGVVWEYYWTKQTLSSKFQSRW